MRGPYKFYLVNVHKTSVTQFPQRWSSSSSVGGRNCNRPSHCCHTVTPAGRTGCTGGQPHPLQIHVLLSSEACFCFAHRFRNSTWSSRQTAATWGGGILLKPVTTAVISYCVVLLFYLFCFKDENIIKNVMGQSLTFVPFRK